jgi:hypothetical protein
VLCIFHHFVLVLLDLRIPSSSIFILAAENFVPISTFVLRHLFLLLLLHSPTTGVRFSLQAQSLAPADRFSSSAHPTSVSAAGSQLLFYFPLGCPRFLVQAGLVCAGRFSPSGFGSLHQDPVPLEFFFVQADFRSASVLATASYFPHCEPKPPSAPSPWLGSVGFHSRVRSSLLAAWVSVLLPLIFCSRPRRLLH